MAEVVVLGAGTPTPTPTRFGSSYALRVGGELLMFDCGPATTHLINQAQTWQEGRTIFTKIIAIVTTTSNKT